MAAVRGVEVVDRPEWDALIYRFTKRGPAEAHLVIHEVIRRAQKKAVETAQHFLDVMVYTAPLPQSAAGREAWYEENRRQGRARESIKARPVTGVVSSTGIVEVDRSDYPAYFYALSLEFGLQRWPRYYPRPFWRSTRAIMAIKFLAEGELGLAALKMLYGSGPQWATAFGRR